MLEQYGFVKSLFDVSSEKVKESAFFSVVVNFIIAAMGYFTYFTNNILGMSVSFIVMLMVIMTTDYITGIRAAKIENVKTCSKKGLRGFFKFWSYIGFLYVMNQFVVESRSYEFDWLTHSLNSIKMFVMITVCFWELKSIDENLDKLGYDFRIFKFLDVVYGAVKSMFKNNTHIDIGDGEE